MQYLCHSCLIKSLFPDEFANKGVGVDCEYLNTCRLFIFAQKIIKALSNYEQCFGKANFFMFNFRHNVRFQTHIINIIFDKKGLLYLIFLNIHYLLITYLKIK